LQQFATLKKTRKLDILKNKSSLGWSGFGSITEKEQRKIGQIRTPKKRKATRKRRERIGQIGHLKKRE
jgi:hypothetical protein